VIKRVFDLPLLLRATDTPEFADQREVFTEWFDKPKNLMFADGDNVGLATYEYPGVYSVHWFYQVRGREALDLGRAMCQNLFDNYGAETLRAIIEKRLKASRWATRQIGFKSHGFVTTAEGEEELFFATKAEFEGNNNG